MDETWPPTRRRRLPDRLDLPVVVAALIVAAVVLMAVFAPLISPHDPLAQVLVDRLKPPAWVPGGSSTYLLGTDANGRDILSRIIWGGRTSLQIGILSVALGASIGVTSGLLAGYRGGWLDLIIGRLADIQQAIPLLILALAIIAVVGSSILNLVLVLGAGSWLYYHRVVRGEVMAIREHPYVEAARAVGASDWRIVTRHILPNVAGLIVVLVTLEIPQVILFTAGLTFLGLGVPPPTPEWGRLIFEGRDYLQSAWWLTLAPAAVLVVTVLGVNLLGDALRDRLDPRRRHRGR